MKRFVAIEILPEHIDIVLMRGGTSSGSRRVTVELPSEFATWAKALRSAAPAIVDAVNELNAAKLPAIVLYRSPTQAVDLTSLDLKSAEQAEEAASLDCLGGLSFNTDAATLATYTLGRDQSGDTRKTHVIVAADHTSVLNAIIEVIEGAGLRVEIVSPLDAAISAIVSKRSMRRATPLQGWLYIGEQSSYFVIAGDGKIYFGRGLSLGVETLARTLTRPIRMRGKEEPIELDLDTAASIIHRVGVPRGEQVVYEPLGLTGTQLRPLVQPVLQRYIVELRQSMRFAVPDEELKGMPITLLGPGSALAGFAELLDEELDVRAQRHESDAVYDRNQPGCVGSSLHDAIADARLLKALTLLPPAMAGKRRGRELKRWLWAGTAAAVGLVALDAMQLSKKVERAAEHVEALANQSTEDEALRATRLKLANATAALTALENDIHEELAACVSFRAIMQELTRLTPESIRLVNISFAVREGVMTASLRGYAVKPNAGASDTGMGNTALKKYIEDLHQSPLVSDIELLNVERGQLDSKPAESFQASIDFVSILPSLNVEQIVVAPEGAEP